MYNTQKINDISPELIISWKTLKCQIRKAKIVPVSRIIQKVKAGSEAKIKDSKLAKITVIKKNP